ncbi:MAG: hypothetical protein ACLSA0_25145 [Eisenbergiella massiliensis]
MLITRETDYALRILRSLAQGSCLTVGELAEKGDAAAEIYLQNHKKAGKSGNHPDYPGRKRRLPAGSGPA